MRAPERTARRWLETAREDLEFARYAAVADYHAQACFHAHQAAEMAIKAIHYAQGARLVLGHGIRHLVEKLHAPNLEAVLPAARELDLYYVPTRYPNGLDDGTPSEAFGAGQSTKALGLAQEIVSTASTMIGQQAGY